MALLNGTDLKKVFSGETLFENVSFLVNPGDKIGLIGANGAGKSTLFKLITGELEPDGGELFQSREVKIGYLAQHPVSDGSRTLLEEMLTAFSQVIELEDQLEAVHRDLECGRGDPAVLAARQAELRERFTALGGPFFRSRVRSALLGLGFSEADFSLPLDRLSGGQRTRAALCKVLLSEPDLLLLDEPTNHLDIPSVEWLEDHLTGYRGAFMVISHDRYFLDRVTNRTFALEGGRFYTGSGNYSAYIAQREIERLTRQRNYDYTTREIRRLEDVVEQQRRWKHKKNKKTHTLDNTRKAIERLESALEEPDKAPETMRFRFTACPGGAQRALEARDLGMAFGEDRLFRHVDLLVKKGEKVFLLGPNGCGKTTLLKIFLGRLPQTEGSFRVGDNTHVGYYDQMKENLHREKTVIDEIWDEFPRLTQTEVRSALAVFLFKGEDVFHQIRTLSGGELARVELTKLLLRPVNLLILDEPTNHLDIDSREALEAALAGYDGTMLAVSHDRYFINKLADRILYLTPEGVTEHRGNYDAFLADRQQTPPEKKEKPPEKGAAYQERKRQEAQRRKILNRHARVEAQIEQTEAQIRDLTLETEDPETARDYVRLSQHLEQIDRLREALDGYMAEWEELQALIDGME